MSYLPGEIIWYDKATPELREVFHRKPWIAGLNDPTGMGCGAMLADAAAIVSLLPPPPARVLDAGCAEGYLAHVMSLCGYEVVALDVCRSVIQEAASRHVWWNGTDSSPMFVACDFDDHPFDHFSAVVFASALHHSRYRVKTLQSAFNALLPGGILIASEPGIGHGSTRQAKEHARTWNVTEKSTPPYAVARDGWKVGFRQIKVYPNPITLHKAAYATEGLSHHRLVKLAAKVFGVAAVAGAKWLHGITTMRKP